MQKSPRNVDLKDIKRLKAYKKKILQFVAVTVNPK